jgi:hypothetical protein
MGCRVVTISGASGLQGLARPEGVDPGRANREAMPDLTAKRTLVKSPPELWSELSEVERLARHLGAFGEIKITKLEPEHTVAWEGEGASGTVSIEPSGWGTRVTLTAQLEGGVAQEEDVTPPDSATLETAAGKENVTPPESATLETAAGEELEDEAAVAAPVAEPAVDEPAVVEAPAVEAPAPKPVEPIEPIAARPRRKRGFLAWLFRQRTSDQVAAPPVPARSEPVAEAPVVEVPPVAERPPVLEEPPVTEQPHVAQEAPAAEEAPVAEERQVADETGLAEVAPLVDEPVGVEAGVSPGGSATEEAAADEAPLDPERAQAVLDGALDALGSAHHRPFSRG